MSDFLFSKVSELSKTLCDFNNFYSDIVNEAVLRNMEFADYNFILSIVKCKYIRDHLVCELAYKFKTFVLITVRQRFNDDKNSIYILGC